MIEMMIAVAVLAIVTTLALPSYRAIIEKREVTRGAEELAAFLSQAKSQAVKLNEDVTMSYEIDGTDWCLGYTNTGESCDCSNPAASNYCRIEYDYDRDGTVDATEPRVFGDENFTHPGILNSITFTDAAGDALSSGSVVRYDAVRGMLEVVDAGSEAANASLAFVSTGGQYALNIEIDRLGRVSLCSPDSEDHLKVPGYDTCAN